MSVCIILPGLLEAGTRRGGGRESQHYRIGLELSKTHHTIIISPFYKKFRNYYLANDGLIIEEVYFPACKEYPPFSAIGRYLIPFSMILYSFLSSIKAISLVKKRRLKVLIVTDILTGFLPSVLGKLFKVKVIFSEGNLWPWVNPYIFHVNLSLNQKIMYSTEVLFGTLLCHLSDLIRVQSPLIKKGMVKHGVDSSKVIIIESGIDADKFKPLKIQSTRNLRIAFIGRLTDEKGAPLLLEVCKRAEKDLPEVKFLIFGDGPYRENFKQLKNIEHIGWVYGEFLSKLLSNVNIVLFFQKDLGIAEIEALASGKVIIAPNIGEIPKVIQQNINGVICPPNTDAYIESIKSISSNIELLQSISKNSKETAVSLFDWTVIGAKWRELIQYILRI